MKYLIFLFLLTACTTTIDCPTCKCDEPSVKTIQPTETTLIQHDLEIHFIDVGQGDATLIKGSDIEMLIDCGKNNKGPELVEYLENEGVQELEYLVMTHPDSDHIGGCDDVLKHFETKTVIHNGEEKDTLTYREVQWELDNEQQIVAEEGMEWQVGWSTIKVLQALKTGDSNQRSIVLHLNEGTFDVLFTADCDSDCEERLSLNEVEILRVAHHGSDRGTSTKFLQETKPTYAIISVGDNSYGHPSDMVLDRLEQDNVITYRTDIDGTIIVKTNGDKYFVH